MGAKWEQHVASNRIERASDGPQPLPTTPRELHFLAFLLVAALLDVR